MRFIVGLLLAFVLSTSVCHADDVWYTDGTGEHVIYGQNAKRIVSLAPSVTEMLYFLGFGSRVVGRSSYCNYPPEVLKVASVGGFVDASIEKIVSLEPDIVVAYKGNSLDLVLQLRELNINVVAFSE